MTLKEKVENIMGNFLDRNKNYAVHTYVRNGVTENIIARLLIPVNRTAKSKEEKYSVEWKVADIECNDFSLPYDEIMDCYVNSCEYGRIKIGKSVVVILKNGMKIEFECCGERI